MASTSTANTLFIWIKDNMLWDFFSFLLYTVILSMLVLPLYRGWKKSKILLKDNRKPLGAGFGTYAVDVYLNAWNDIEYDKELTKTINNQNQTL